MPKAGRVQKLSKRFVVTLVPEPARFIVWDEALRGFGLRVEPSGHKTFIARYRAGGGRTGTLRQTTLGRFGTVTLDQARAKAKTVLGAAAGGGDPLGERKRARQAGVTVAEVCDWYLKDAEAGRILGRHGRPIKPSTLATDRSRIVSHVKPLIGKRTVRSLSLHDIEEMQADIATKKTARIIPKGKKRPRGGISLGGGGTGARTLVMVRAIFEHAVRRRLIESNPAKGARKIADRQRKFRLSIEQVRMLGRAMAEAASKGESQTGLAAIRLLLLTGFRKSEALGLRPAWLLAEGGIDFPDTKSGPQVRPIGKAAMAQLRSRADVGGDWIFPGDRGPGHFVGLPKVLARVTNDTGLKGVTPHVLRHTFASIAGELGFSELTIAGLLGHSAGSVTSAYVHLDSSLVAAADRVSATIADALDGEDGAEVIPLRREAR